MSNPNKLPLVKFISVLNSHDIPINLSEIGFTKLYGYYTARFADNDGACLYSHNGVEFMADGAVKNPTNKVTAKKVDNHESAESIPCNDVEEAVARKYIQLKNSARKRNKDFDLKLSDVRKLVVRKTCYYTGITLGNYEDCTHPQQRTVDRVDATRGYVKGNVVACSHLANQFKNKIEHDFVDFMPRSSMLKILEKMFS